MRRRVSLVLVGILAALVVLASVRYFSSRSDDDRTVAARGSDTLVRADSAARTQPEPVEQDTSCIASRLGLPCATR
jgi:hypothetical protein